MTCKDLIDILSDYLEATLSDQSMAALERHLEGCAPCVAYLNTFRKTRELTGAAGGAEMPDEMKSRLRSFLLEHLPEIQS